MKKNILAICSPKGGGKTTLINMIKEIYYKENNYWIEEENKLQILNFADSLKDQIITLTGCSKSDLESQEFKNSLSPLTIYDYRVGDFFLSGKYKTISLAEHQTKSTTYRELHEIISDDTKKRFGPQVYVESLFNKYDPTKHLIIGDLRYSKNTSENEEGEIKKRGGIIVKLTRPNLEGDFSHSSENSIKDIEADIEHTNIELEDLFNLAKRIVEQYLK